MENANLALEAGEKIGVVGSTGRGPEGTRGRFEPHLLSGWPGDDGPAPRAGP